MVSKVVSKIAPMIHPAFPHSKTAELSLLLSEFVIGGGIGKAGSVVTGL